MSFARKPFFGACRPNWKTGDGPTWKPSKNDLTQPLLRIVSNTKHPNSITGHKIISESIGVEERGSKWINKSHRSVRPKLNRCLYSKGRQIGIVNAKLQAPPFAFACRPRENGSVSRRRNLLRGLTRDVWRVNEHKSGVPTINLHGSRDQQRRPTRHCRALSLQKQNAKMQKPQRVFPP